MRRACLAFALALAVLVSAPVSALTVERIGSTVRHHTSDVRACYVHALTLRPALSGQLVVRFTVEASGVVSAVRIERDTVGDRSMNECVLAAVRGWQFPRGAEAETVSYPFQFAR